MQDWVALAEEIQIILKGYPDLTLTQGRKVCKNILMSFDESETMLGYTFHQQVTLLQILCNGLRGDTL